MKKFLLYLAIVYVIILAYTFTDVDEIIYPPTVEVESFTYPKTVSTLVILMEFSDVSLQTEPSDWYSTFFGNKESLRHYYLENSNHLLNVEPAYDGVYKVKVKMKHPRYSSSSQLDGLQDYYEFALSSLDDEIDYASFDQNEDGFTTSDELAVIIVMAGYEDYEENEKYVTSGAFSENEYITLDGTELSNVMIVGEITKEYDEEIQTTIGVFCHEFGHALGLPDLYDTDYSSQGLGIHSLMAAGTDNRGYGQYFGQSPAPLSAWSKEFLGIAIPREIDEAGTYTIASRINDAEAVYKIDNGDTYYLLEYATFKGYGKGLDELILNEGLVILEVDPSSLTSEKMYYNEVNIDENNYGVKLIEAQGEDTLLAFDFDYLRDDYNHYFSLNGINEVTLDNGDFIKIIDQTNSYIEIQYLKK